MTNRSVRGSIQNILMGYLHKNPEFEKLLDSYTGQPGWDINHATETIGGHKLDGYLIYIDFEVRGEQLDFVFLTNEASEVYERIEAIHEVSAALDRAIEALRNNNLASAKMWLDFSTDNIEDFKITVEELEKAKEGKK